MSAVCYASVLILILFITYSSAENTTVCPKFNDGTGTVGELKNIRNGWNVPSEIPGKVYSEKTAASCCYACSLVEECKYWTLILGEKGAVSGTCHLFRSFACDKSYDGSLPFVENELALSGKAVCTAPKANTSVSVVANLNSQLGEVRDLLKAQIAVREEEAGKWKKAGEEAEKRKRTAEEHAGKWRRAAAVLEESVKKARLELESLQTDLSLAKSNFTQSATEAALEAAAAKKAKEEQRRLHHEIKHATKTQAAAESLLSSVIAVSTQNAKYKRDANPYAQCPEKLANGSWVVGLLRDLTDSSGNSTKLSKTVPDSSPMDCCKECAALAGCEFWTWQVEAKLDTKGVCSFFTGEACSADADGNLPFQRNTFLGRVGPKCKSSAE